MTKYSVMVETKPSRSSFMTKTGMSPSKTPTWKTFLSFFTDEGTSPICLSAKSRFEPNAKTAKRKIFLLKSIFITSITLWSLVYYKKFNTNNYIFFCEIYLYSISCYKKEIIEIFKHDLSKYFGSIKITAVFLQCKRHH